MRQMHQGATLVVDPHSGNTMGTTAAVPATLGGCKPCPTAFLQPHVKQGVVGPSHCLESQGHMHEGF